ncbi:MAG: acyl-ACP--UDP-N- acetylglucosamine O-acyltransferase [Helicobacteraceae bacterium]|nr:acyl-ACP--UDP-N- acetylglucosamine O-acyltransferase [Helicobacteraceae bacterium]
MIHKTAIIDESATISENVKISAFCTIGKNVVLKDGVQLEAHVIISDNVTIGENSKIYSFTRVGNGVASVNIGKSVQIREFSQIGLQGDENLDLNIDNECFIMAYSQLYTGVNISNNVILTNGVTLHEGVQCNERVIIGGLSTIHDNLIIGGGVMIGGASNAKNSIPPYTLVEGNPAEVKGLNIIGLRRRIDDKDELNEIKVAFKEIFRAEGQVDSSKAEDILNSTESSFVKELASFATTTN